MRGPVHAAILALALPVGLSAQGLVDVGGHRLDVSVRGSGTPTVILESGMGEGREYWDAVQDSLSGFVRVLSYSLSGLGASEYSRRTGAVDAVEELRTLLAQLQIDPELEAFLAHRRWRVSNVVGSCRSCWICRIG